MIRRPAWIAAALLVVVFAAGCAGEGPNGSKPDAGPPAPAPPPLPPAPATPDGFQLFRFLGGAILVWNPVPGATTYLVGAHASSGAAQTLRTSDTAIAVGYDASVGDVDFDVTALNAGGSSLPTPTIRAPQHVPSLSVAVVGREAVVSWTADPALGNDAVIGRGTTNQNIATIGGSSSGSFTDSQIQQETNYVYQVALRRPPLTVLSATTNVSVKLFPPQGITVAYGCCGSLQLDWQPVAGASAYSIDMRRDPAGPSIFDLPMTAPPSFSIDCAGAPDCFFTVATIDQTGALGNPSVPVHAFLPPGAPTPAAQSRIGSVAITIDGSPQFADHFIFSRADQQDGPFVDIGVTTALQFVDGSVPPWTRRWYHVTAVSRGGTSLQPSFAVSGFATEPPDQVNLANAAFLVSQQNGQSFTVGSPGQLMGIEVEVPPLSGGPRTIELWSAGRLLGIVDGTVPEGQGRTLVPDMVAGVYFDVSGLAIPVSSGEQLRFQFAPGFLDANRSSYAGGTAYIAGSPDAANDLVFKTFVKADTALASPDSLSATGGAGAIRLDWRASPGAISYRVLRSDVPGQTPSVEVGRTDQVWFLDIGLAPGSTYTYVVEALDGASATAASSPATATVRSLLLDQEHLGDGPGPREVFVCTTRAPASVGQTFTAGRSGQLVGIEVSKAIGGDYDVEVLDVASNSSFGTVLAGSTSGPFFCPSMPLVPGVVGEGFVDLSPLAITVSAGQALRVRLTPTVTTACICLLDAAGGYTGGSEEAGDQPVSDRDLAFRTFVQ